MPFNVEKLREMMGSKAALLTDEQVIDYVSDVTGIPAEDVMAAATAVTPADRRASKAAAVLGRRGGKVGGLVRGATKARGDAAYYRALNAKSRASREANKASKK